MTGWQITPGLHWRQLDDEVIALTGSQAHLLSGGGAAVFLLIAARTPWPELVALIADADQRLVADVSDDVIEALRVLVANGLVTADD